MGSIISRLCGSGHDVEGETQSPQRQQPSDEQVQAYELASNPAAGAAENRSSHAPSAVDTAGSGSNRSETSIAHSGSEEEQVDDELTHPNVQQLARETYQEGRLYHGTSQDQLLFMAQNGMDTKNKTGTTVEAAISKGRFPGSSPEDLNELRNESSKWNYLTAKLEPGIFVPGAKDYANLASSEGDPPRIMRVMTGKDGHGLQPDGGSNVGGTVRNNPAVQTEQKISPGNILASKGVGPVVTDASEAFKDRFNTSDKRPELNVNTTLTSEQAARLLHEQQTPSEDDFPLS